MKKLLLSLVLGTTILSGCAYTVYVPPEQAKAIAPLMYAEPSAERTAKVTIVRDESEVEFISTAFTIYDNNEKIAEIQQGEKTTVYLKPGENVFYIEQALFVNKATHIYQLKPNSDITLRCFIPSPYLLELKQIR